MLVAVLNGGKPISEELYQRYADNFRHAVDAVPMSDEDLAAQWRANVSRFAAYKAFHTTNELRITAEEEGGDLDMLQAVLHKYNRYQAVEYNTAVSRARTGKQWQEFDDKDNRRLFPCIKWLPSRSASPREEHMPFYNRIWSKDDPFWNTNQPGTLWNCKCDWEQTDEEPTENNPTNNITKPGLDRNPATSGQIFTDTAAYFRKAGNNRKERDYVEKLCQNVGRHILQQQAKNHPLISQTALCEIDGVEHTVQFRDYSIREYAEKMYGSRQYWLKNEIINNMPDYIKNATYINSKDVDLTHNSGRTLRLKKKLKAFHYFRTSLPDGTSCLLEIVEYKTGEYCFYTMIKE